MTDDAPQTLADLGLGDDGELLEPIESSVDLPFKKKKGYSRRSRLRRNLRRIGIVGVPTACLTILSALVVLSQLGVLPNSILSCRISACSPTPTSTPSVTVTLAPITPTLNGTQIMLRNNRATSVVVATWQSQTLEVRSRIITPGASVTAQPTATGLPTRKG